MEKNKLYPCKECGTKVPIRSKGLCGFCRNQQRISNGSLTIKKYSIKPISDKKKSSKDKDCLDAFFSYHINKLERVPFSVESGDYISSPSRANVCHLIDKGRHKSVQCLLENAIYLTLEEHSRFDSLLFKHEFGRLELEFPKAWKIYCNKVVKILEMCLENTKFVMKLKEYLVLKGY